MRTRLRRLWWKIRWSRSAYPEVSVSSLTPNEFKRLWNTTGAKVISRDGRHIATIHPRWNRSVFK